MQSSYDVIVAGGGPGGLSAAETIARLGKSVVVLEQGKEIGSPTRTTGGSFVRDMVALGVPPHLYHSVHRCRFISPNQAAAFEYRDPVMCVTDVRGLFQYLAERAIDAGARIAVATTATEPTIEDGHVTGVKVKCSNGSERELKSRILMDATGHRASLLRQAGIYGGSKRFGVGSEYDMYAPHFNQDEAVLIVGSQVAPFGYAWLVLLC